MCGRVWGSDKGDKNNRQLTSVRSGGREVFIWKWVFSAFKCAWQLLRLFAIVLVIFWISVFFRIIVEWALSPASLPVFYDPNVCGKISGYVLRYPPGYVMYWPEYEGKSSWESGFVNNKKGCGANLTSLTMMVSWPDMKPVDFSVGTSSGFTGMTITIRPSLPIFEGMSKVLETSLWLVTPEQKRSAKYKGYLDLYHVRGYGPIWRDSYSDFYWSERGGAVEHVIYCQWFQIQNKNYRCRSKFLIPELDAFAEVSFPSENINLWREILGASVDFLNDGLIGSE